jgi:MATE family multidrug resistance protein
MQTIRYSDWWHRECGGRDVVRIALPLVVSTGCLSLMMFVDRMFLLWQSPEAMSAAMPAGVLFWALVCFPFGVAQYVNTFVAQYHGAQRPQRIGAVVWQGIYISLATIPIFLFLIPLAPYIFGFFEHGQLIEGFEVTYFRWLTFCAGAMVLNGALSSFFIGRGKTSVVMWVNVFSTIINIVLDYVLIFGALALPEMGIAGAAIATVVSQWFKVVVYFKLMFSANNRQQFGLDRATIDPSLIGRLVRFGGPNGMQMLVEVSAFSLMILFMGRLGSTAMAATTLAFNVNAVAFIPMVGVSIAVGTLVGQQLTGGSAKLAARATWTAMQMGLAYSLFFGLLCLFAPGLFMFGHAAGIDAAAFVEIRATTILLLRFVAAYCMFDTLQIVFVGALKGAGDTRFVLVNTLCVSLITVVVGWYGDTYHDGELLWWWSVVTAWILALGATNFVRFVQGRWRDMRVIERSVQEPMDDGVLVNT